MKRRLLIFLSLCLILAIAITAHISLNHSRRAYESFSRKYLNTAVNYARQACQRGEEPSAIAASLKEAMDEEGRGLRLTILRKNGEVIFDTDAESGEMENHAARPELVAIVNRGEESGVDIRHSRSVNLDYIYLAKAVPSEDLIIRCALPLQAEAQDWENFRLRISLAALIVLLVSLGIFALLLKYYLDPIEELEQKASQLAEGDLDARVNEEAAKAPELLRLSSAFNNMADEVRESTERLKQQSEWQETILQSLQEPLLVVNREHDVVFANRFALELFQRGVDPREHPFPLVLMTRDKSLDSLCSEVIQQGVCHRRELELPGREGKKPYQLLISPLNQDSCLLLFHDLGLEMEARLLRSSFVANVTHELKTPLTSIRGFVETLRSDPNLEAEKREHFLAIIEAETTRLSELIQDILELSKLEEKGSEAPAETFDLNGLIDELLVSLDDVASKQGVHLIGEDEPEALMVNASREQLKELIRNLLENGIKYNHKGGKVRVRASRPDDVLIEVSDDGEGIETQYLPRIFERFYRIPRGDNEPMVDGTGLGLAIVKHIALRHHGYVEVLSKKGEGTSFRVHLKI